MPNPLSVTTSAPAASARTGANAKDTDEPKMDGSFQSVLEEQAQPATDEVETPTLATPDTDVHQAAVQLDHVAENDQDAPANDDPIAEVTGPQSVETDLADTASPIDPPSLFTVAAPALDQRAIPDEAFRRSVDMTTQTAALPNAGELPLAAKVVPVTHKLDKSHDHARPAQEFTGGFSNPGRDPVSVISASVPAKKPSSPDKAPSVVQMQLMMPNPQDGTGGLLVTESDEALPLKDISTLSQTRETAGSAHALTTAPRTETTRAIAGQMAAVINARPQGGIIEIALNPEELGRVSIVLNNRDDGMHLTIATERPETLDMMRRHISVLETEFKNLGFGDLSFDLGSSAHAQQDAANTETGSEVEDDQNDPTPLNALPAQRLGATGRIDLRL